MPTLSHKLASLLLGLILSGSVLAADPAFNPSHPERYVVVKGDTLWDISSRFLRDPWRWPDVWFVNPQIANPHLIYPGDVVVLTYVDGKPMLTLERGSLVKLSPRVRSTPIDQAIPAIPLNAIQPFLDRSYVLSREEIDGAPYVVSFGEEHLRAASGINAYVRNLTDEDSTNYEVVRPGEAYRDADTGELLGYEARYVGNAELTRAGDPATFVIVQNEMETNIGDRLFPVTEQELLETFYPKAPDVEVAGSIISVLNGLLEIGEYHVVVIDRGADDGMQQGDVLAIDHKGPRVPDTVKGRGSVKLPDEQAGMMLVFRVFPRVSFGLVMHATRNMYVGDRVRNP